MKTATTWKDKILKYQLYQEAGVKYYCIVDPDANSVDVFTLQDDNYKKARDFKHGKMIFDLGPCTIAFDFREIF